MTGETWRERFVTSSEKAPELARQLAFAAIAIVWVFKSDVGDKPVIPSQLSAVALWAVIFLAMDLLSYVTASIIFARRAHSTAEKPSFEVSNFDIIAFSLKIGSIIYAYVLLLHYLGSNVYARP